MKRRLSTLATILSLTLFLFTLLLWLRSYSGDDLTYYGPPEYFEFISSDGLLRIGYGEMTVTAFPPRRGWNTTLWPITGPRRHNSTDLSNTTTFGFRYERWISHRTSIHGQAHVLTFPYWFLTLLTATLPTLAFIRHRRHKRALRRQQRGQCPRCGYDLRATPTQCPECGTRSPALPSSNP